MSLPTAISYDPKGLICPICRRRLFFPQKTLSTLYCQTCHKKYPVKEGIPILIDKLDGFKRQEKRLSEFEAKRYNVAKEKKWFPNFEIYQKALSPLFRLPRSSQILELGAGVSYISPLFIKKGHSLVLTDIAFSVLKRTRQYLNNCGLDKKASFIVIDSENIPFQESNFDGVFVISSFHHFPNQAQVLAETKRVVKNRGLIVLVCEPNWWSYKTIFPATRFLRLWLRKKTFRRYDSIADERTSGFSKDDLISLFNKENIEVEAIFPCLFLTQFYAHFLIFLNRLFGIKLERKENAESFFNKIDNFLAKVPPLNYFFWHWSVVGRIKK